MKKHYYHLTVSSGNRKLGPIPVTTTSRSTCPSNCSYKANGCYAEAHPLRMHWDKVSSGERGVTLDQLCEEVRALPKFQLWRWAQAGDLPGDGKLLDGPSVKKLVQANKGKNGFGYTHYDPTLSANRWTIQAANTQGFTLNLSAETLEQADKYMALKVAPVVVVLPADQTEPTVTPAGHPVIVCPASIGDTTCAQCAICAKPDRKSIVGFPAHGSGRRKVEAIFFATKESA